MSEPMISVRPNGAEMLRFSGAVECQEVETGWRAEMRFAPASPDVTAAQVIGEAADFAAGESHYGGQVREYDPIAGRIVVEGVGPAPAV
jgi:hypothetical protein